jgi:4a-hydroxytetrahydrobiopterin dehydratase
VTERLTRTEISAGVTGHGWRLVLGVARASVPVPSLADAVEAAAVVVAAAGPDADEHLWLDVRADRLVMSVQSRAIDWLTASDIELVGRITGALAQRGLVPAPAAAQLLEVGIDALDIPAVRPFWRAVLGYVDEAGALVDPHGHGPAFWFQRMDAPRPQRNRIHIDVSVPHDEAADRIAAAVAAGGTLLSDAEAPAFWVLADPEGNEACVTTWQGRD